MTKTRLETFTDGVVAILITIMVLELKAPETPDWHGLRESMPSIGTYALSFVLLAMYWNNHHNMMHGMKSGRQQPRSHVRIHVNGPVKFRDLAVLIVRMRDRD